MKNYIHLAMKLVKGNRQKIHSFFAIPDRFSYFLEICAGGRPCLPVAQMGLGVRSRHEKGQLFRTASGEAAGAPKMRGTYFDKSDPSTPQAGQTRRDNFFRTR
jgi:hypothetical protein